MYTDEDDDKASIIIHCEEGGNSISRSSSLQILLSEIAHNRQRMVVFSDAQGPFIRDIYSDLYGERCAFWVATFTEAFFKVGDSSSYKDDLLLFVIKNEDRVIREENGKAEIKVFRRTSPSLPRPGDRSVDWEETVYLNLIMQYFTYVLTVAVVTRTGPQEYQIITKVSHKVYASPSKRDMDSKGTEEEIVYPNIYFTVDNFDEVFCKCIVRDSESICAELTAYDHNGQLQGVIFLGTVRYATVKNIFDSRNSISNRLTKQKNNWFRTTKRMEFIKMLGPDSKGHAQIAISSSNTLNGSQYQLNAHDSDMGFSYDNAKMATSFTNGSCTSYSADNSPMRRPSDEFSHTNKSKYDYQYQDRKNTNSKVADLVAGGRLVKNVLNSKLKKSQSDGGTFEGLGLTKIDVQHDGEPSIYSEDFDEYSQMSTSWGQSFTQAWYWFKERRKVSSVALNASVTYISLPWHRIIGDLLDTKMKPILTFENIAI